MPKGEIVVNIFSLMEKVKEKEMEKVAKEKETKV